MTHEGEQRVDVVYCRVHPRRTLMRRFGANSCLYRAVVRAITRFTRGGCEDALAYAMELATPEQKLYIQRN